jgi:hypothetical protein
MDVTGSSTMAASDRSLDPGGDASVRPGLGKTATVLVWMRQDVERSTL